MGRPKTQTNGYAMINAIFAMDANGGIGKNGTLPWPKNSRDFRWFRSHTTNKIVVMGKNTWDDPNMPKPLPKRHNVVITSKVNSLPYYENLDTVSIQDARSWLVQNSNKELFIIGGAKVLTEYWDLIERFYITEFPDSYDCDTFISNDNLDSMKSKRMWLAQSDFDDLQFKVYG